MTTRLAGRHPSLNHVSEIVGDLALEPLCTESQRLPPRRVRTELVSPCFQLQQRLAQAFHGLFVEEGPGARMADVFREDRFRRSPPAKSDDGRAAGLCLD